jgi:hypothetical protein
MVSLGLRGVDGGEERSYVFSAPIEGQRLQESELVLQAFMRLLEKSLELHLGTSYRKDGEV